jgi:NitT/TauT family transport system permease protein
MGLNRQIAAFFRPTVVIGLAIPDLVYIIVAILVLGTEESSGLIALVIALVPFVVNIVVGGVRARDQGLDEMSAVYRLGRRRYSWTFSAGRWRRRCSPRRGRPSRSPGS